jgi:mono/diheme cytochrome c family protein
MQLKALVLVLAVQGCLAAHAEQPDGRAVFDAQCAVCHQPKGQGVPGQFPQLARNSDLFLARDFPVRVVLFGMTGKIRVNGQTIDGAMPPLGNVLKDEEIAAVVNFVRGAFGNGALRSKSMQPVDAVVVADLRKQENTVTERVFSYRKSLKAGPAKN